MLQILGRNLRNAGRIYEDHQGDALSFPVPKGAFYAFIRIETPKWKKDLEFVRAALKEGVVFVPGSGFGRQEDGVYSGRRSCRSRIS